MNSAFLVFDLIGRNTTSQGKLNARGLIHPELEYGEEAVGFVVRKEHQSSASGQSFAKDDGAHQI